MVLAILRDTGEQNLAEIKRGCIGSGETDMNRFGSRPNHENKPDACGHRHTEWKLNKPPGML